MTSGKDKNPPQPEGKIIETAGKKPVSPVIIGAVNFISGIFCLVIFLSMSFTYSRVAGQSAGYLLASAGIIISIPMTAGGCGLFFYRRWGRITSLAAIWISLAVLLVYLVFMAGTYIYIYDMLDRPGSIKFIIRLITISILCIYPALALFLLHSGKVKHSMK